MINTQKIRTIAGAVLLLIPAITYIVARFIFNAQSPDYFAIRSLIIVVIMLILLKINIALEYRLGKRIRVSFGKIKSRTIPEKIVLVPHKKECT